MSASQRILIQVIADSKGVVTGLQPGDQALDRTAAKARAAGTSIGTHFTNAGRKLDSAGRTMTRNVTLPTIAAGAAAVKMSLDFDRSMSHISSLVGANKKDMALYREEVLKLSKGTAKAPQELAEALYFVTSSGFSGASALKVLEASAKASAAGLAQTETVADAVTSAVNAYGEENLSAMKATDILTAAVREGKVEGEEFAGSIGRVIPIAAEMGIGFHEVAGNLAAMSMSGLDAAEGATALRGIMSSLLKPTDDARDAFKKMGYSVDEFRTLVKNRGVLPALLELKERVGDNVDMWGRLFPNVRALAGALNLNGRNADKNVRVLDALGNAVGDTDKAFDKAKKSDAWKMDKRMNDLRIAAVKLGETLLPIALDIAEAVADLGKAFSKLDPSLQKWIIGGMVLGGPSLRVAGAGAKGIGWLLRSAGVGAATSGAGGAAAGGGALAGAGLPIAATAAVAGAGFMTIKTLKDQADATLVAREALQKHNLTAKDAVKALESVEGKGGVVTRVLGEMARGARRSAGGIEIANDALVEYSRLMDGAGKISKGERRDIARTVETFEKLGLAIDDDLARRVNNLLKVGDAKGALKLLKDALLDLIGATDKAVKSGKSKLAEFGGSADIQRAKVAMLEDRVRGLAAAINGLPSSKTVSVNVIQTGTYAGKHLPGAAPGSAVGHVVRGAQVRTVGEGHYATPFGTGAEMVMPLSEKVLRTVGDAMGGGGRGPINVTVKGNVYGINDWKRQMTDVAAAVYDDAEDRKARRH